MCQKKGTPTRKQNAGRTRANWALKYTENSDAACSTDIRFFRRRKNAHSAMLDDFRKQDAILHFPTCEDPFAERHRSVTYDSIYVQDGIDTFHWEIVKIIPEDA